MTFSCSFGLKLYTANTFSGQWKYNIGTQHAPSCHHSLFNCENNRINRRILDCINHITQLLWEQFIPETDRCIAMYGACLTDSTCVHSSRRTGRNDPMCASGPLKHKKPLCIISWGGGMERQRGGVWSWGRGQWPYSQPTRWPHSQRIGILCLPPLFFITFTILPSLSTALLAFFLSANTINQLSRDEAHAR